MNILFDVMYRVRAVAYLAGTTERTECFLPERDGPETVSAIVIGSVFVLPTNVRHNLANVGTDTLRAVAFFAAAMFLQNFEN